MKSLLQKQLIINKQQVEMLAFVPMLFLTYTNVTNHDFIYLKSNKHLAYSFFNSALSSLRDNLFPLSRGSFFLYPLINLSEDLVLSRKLSPLCVTLGNYLVSYDRFDTDFRRPILFVRERFTSFFLLKTLFPLQFQIVRFYQLFYFILLKHAYNKSATEKM